MLFIDTGAFIAKFLPADQFHIKATEIWKQLDKKQSKIVTSNFVLDETLTLLARRSSYEFAAEIAQALYSSEATKIVRPTLETELSALTFFEKFSDQKISFTDCISFVVMANVRIETALTFDRHFVQAGFRRLP